MQRSNTMKPAFGRPESARSNRSNSPANSASRPKISGPIELIHTTNMLSYNAPDLPRPSTSSSGQSSARSVTNTDDESDSSPSTAASSPPTSPDVPSSELKRSVSPEPNHLSCYFMPPPAPQAVASSPSPMPPAIPQRAASHTKQGSIDAVARQRSNSRLSKETMRSVSTRNYAFTRSASTSTTMSSMSRDSIQTQSTGISSVASTPISPITDKVNYSSTQHPFGQELAQVTEIAEEFGVGGKLGVIDEEGQEMVARGLCKINVDVYLHDIQNLASVFFHDRDISHARPAPTAWI
jgi:hypothetical protein